MTNDDDGGWIGGGEPKRIDATPDVLIKVEQGRLAAGGGTLGKTLRHAVGVHNGDARIVDGCLEIQGELAQRLEGMANEQRIGVLSLVVDLLEGKQDFVV